MIVLLALLALSAGVVIYLLATQGKTPRQDDNKPTQEQIDNELASLQQEFQTLIQEKVDLTRFEAKAKDFARRFPAEPDGHVLLAQVQMRLEQWAPAYDAWVVALRDRPGEFELCKMAGFCAAKLGRLEVAESHYQEAVRVSGNAADCDVFAALGRLYLAMGDASAAEQAFTKALDAPAPGEETNWKHEARSGLANVAAMRGDFDTALSEISRAIRLAGADSNADTAGYYIQKARIYADASRDDDALTMLNETRRAFPKSLWRIESARLRARLHEKAGELPEAIRYVQSVYGFLMVDEQRDDAVLADFAALLADLQIKAGQLDAARISLHNLEALAPHHPQIDTLRNRMP